WRKNAGNPERRAFAALHRIRDDARAERGAFSRPNSKSENGRRRSKPRACENVHRPAGDDSGKNARQSNERRIDRAPQYVVKLANALRGSNAADSERRRAAKNFRGRAKAGNILLRRAYGGQAAIIPGATA